MCVCDVVVDRRAATTASTATIAAKKEATLKNGVCVSSSTDVADTRGHKDVGQRLAIVSSRNIASATGTER